MEPQSKINEFDEDEELDQFASLQSASSRQVPRTTWFWLGGIILTLLSMLGMIWGMESKTTVADIKPSDSEAALMIPDAPMAPLTIGERASSEEELPLPAVPPLPPLPPPMPVNSMAYTPSPEPVVAPEIQQSRPLSLRERRGGFTSASEPSASVSAEERYIRSMEAASRPPDTSVPSSPSGGVENYATRLANPSMQLVQGTYLPCTLETAIVSDVDGPIVCTVSQAVYSFTGQNLLLPRGTRIFGDYSASDIRRARIAIVWTRLLTPDGVSVQMSNSALDLQGASGVPGRRNSHWLSRVSSALMVSLLSDGFKYLGAKNGPRSLTSYGNGNVIEEPFQSNTAETLQDLANQSITASAQTQATVTVPLGTRVNVYVAKDVDFAGVLPTR